MVQGINERRRAVASRRGVKKNQNAIEFIISYSWALMLIAIALAVLYSLGIFSPSLFTPKAVAGACFVHRSDYGTALDGVCGNLQPQYVMGARGVGDYVLAKDSGSTLSPLNILGNITITAWIKVYGSPYHDIVDKEYQYGMKLDIKNQPNPCVPSNNPGWCLEWDTNNSWIGNGFPIPNAAYGQWMFLAVTLQGSTKYWYANGHLIGTLTSVPSLAHTHANVTIGAISSGWTGYGSAEWFNGTISNVQIYNVSLSANDIDALYLEGIGGVPISAQRIVGWWPLNGNGNDYSGNNDSDVQQQITYTTAWSSGYTTPIS